jgi:hypothetical protein
MVSLENVCNFRPESCIGACINGTCMNCAPGWVHEHTLFRLENCAEPEVLNIVLASFVFVCSTLTQVKVFSNLRNARGEVKKILLATAVSNFALIIMYASLLAYGYAGPAFFFFAAVAACGIAISLTLTTYTYFWIVYASNLKAQFPFGVARALAIISIGTVTIPFIAIMFPASFLDASRYNTMVAAGFLLFQLQVLMTGPMLFVGCQWLINHIRNVDSSLAKGAGNPSSTDNYQQKEDLVRRLRLFQIGFWVVVPCEMGFCTSIAVLYYVYKLPYVAWIVHVLSVITLVWSNAIFSLATAKKQSRAIAHGQPPENNSSVGSKHQLSSTNEA